jgi:hypothetical protein
MAIAFVIDFTSTITSLQLLNLNGSHSPASHFCKQVALAFAVLFSVLLHEAQKANMLHMLTQTNQVQVYDAPRLRPL